MRDNQNLQERNQELENALNTLSAMSKMFSNIVLNVPLTSLNVGVSEYINGLDVHAGRNQGRPNVM